MRGGEEEGGLSAQTVLLLEEPHITALPSSPCLLRSIQTVCVPVASHHRGRAGNERRGRMKDQVDSVRGKITKAQSAWQGQRAEGRAAFKWVKEAGH